MKFIKEVFKKILGIINAIIPKNKHKILLFSGLGYRDNIKAIGDYLINKGYTKKYKIYSDYPNYFNYHSLPKEIKFFKLSKLKTCYHYLTSKYVFYAFASIPIKRAKSQVVIHMWHGTPLKKIGNLNEKEQSNKINFYISKIFATSELFRPIMSAAFACPMEKVVICGHPRNDKLFDSNNSKPNFIKDHKFIFWAPTYRKSSLLNSFNGNYNNLLPLFSTDNYVTLNNHLKEKNIVLLIKLHPVEDIDESSLIKMSNLYIYSHNQFVKEGYDLYETLSFADALISDYSSIFLDYLLLNRPVAFVIEDIEEYRNSRGFVMNNPLDFMPGDKIQTQNEFFNFINDIANGIDKYKDERKRVNDIVNYYKDANNCKRALDIAGIKL